MCVELQMRPTQEGCQQGTGPERSETQMCESQRAALESAKYEY